MDNNPANATTNPLSPGQTFGKYKIVEQIGAGGMSIVWKGHDPLLNQFVAIKQMKLDVTGDEADAFYARVRQEAEIQKRVSQDQKHLVRIIEFIEDQRGLFIVMEYIEGKSLEQFLAADRSPMNIRKALGIVATTAKALGVLHQRQCIHRDLKPSNIMLTKDGGLKLCDFGVATLIADQEAMSLGSVRYMAPELFGNQPADPRSDIYSLGMIAYELLAGREQFEDAFKLVLRDQRNQSLRWMKWHTNARVAAAPLTRLVDDMPQTLSDLVERMMQKDPAARIASTDDLISAIRRHFTSAGVEREQDTETTPTSTAAPVDDTAPTAEIPKPKRWPYIVAAVAIIALLTAGGIGIVNIQKQKQQQQAAFDAARKVFAESKNKFEKGDYQGALAGFDSLYKDWSHNEKLGNQILAQSLMSKAMLAREEADFDKAIEYLEQADKTGEVERQRIRDLIKDFRAQASFADLLAEINRLIDQAKFNDARIRLQQWQRDITPNTEERAKIDELKNRIDKQETQLIVDKILADAANYEASGQRAQAIELLIETNNKYPHPQLQDRIDHYNIKTKYETLVNGSETAEINGDLQLAIDKLLEAAQLLPSDDLDTKIDILRAEQLYNQGKTAEVAGDFEAAGQAYQRALTFTDDTKMLDKIGKAISRITTRNKRQTLIDAAQTSVNNEEYDSAIKLYTEAQQLSFDEDIAKKLVDTQIQKHLQDAKQFLTKDQPQAARESYNKVLELDSESQEAAEGLEKVGRWEEYKKHLSLGDKNRGSGRYYNALTEYRKAREIFETEDIVTRIDDTTAESKIAQAKRFIEAREYQAARSLLVTLDEKYRTEEVIRLLKEIQELDQ